MYLYRIDETPIIRLSLFNYSKPILLCSSVSSCNNTSIIFLSTVDTSIQFENKKSEDNQFNSSKKKKISY